ncbi:hypothetical protein B566_EDAN008418 [Ephemera danica]|nr:hypothetical protein B566_EDAN008418 [Ephemera danica]
MTKLTYFNVAFDNEHGVYYAGQQVRGNIRFGLREPKKITCVRFAIRGRSLVRWTENRSHGKGHDTEVYTSEEEYFNNQYLAFGQEDVEHILLAGDHEYPFCFALPNQIPASFEGLYGHIRYCVRATLVRPWKFNHVTRQLFTVISPLDLNSEPRLAEPTQTDCQKTFTALFSKAAPFSATLSLPVGGAVSGETLLPTVRLGNGSTIKMEIGLKFVAEITYHVRNKSKTEMLKIASKKLGELSSKESRMWSNETFPIPALPPSKLPHCQNIDITYNLVLKLPVVIGTIPLREHFMGFTPAVQSPPLGWNAPPLGEMNAAQMAVATMPPVPPNYDDLPPPTYEQTMSWSGRIRKHCMCTTNMPTLTKFEIVFDNESGVFYAGQKVEGTLIVHLEKPKKLKCIRIEYLGKSSVYWTETRSESSTDAQGNTTSNTVTDSYSSTEEYFNNKFIVFGAEGEEHVLPVGQHKFQFAVQLLTTIPSSFEGTCGKIRYLVQATIVRPWRFNHVVRQHFTVISPLDLNAEPRLAEPTEVTLDHKFGALFWKSKPMSIKLSLPVGGAVGGETIVPSVRIDNESSIKLKEVNLRFLKVVKFYAQGNSTSSTEKIAKKELGKLKEKSSYTWSNESFTIPALPPSNLTHCKNIDVKYILQLKCNPSGPHKDVQLDLELVIGTIPLRLNFNRFISATKPPPLGWNLVPTHTSDPTMSLPSYDDLPPPSYEQSVQGGQPVTVINEDDKYVFGDKTYSPRYPIYTRRY